MIKWVYSYNKNPFFFSSLIFEGRQLGAAKETFERSRSKKLWARLLRSTIHKLKKLIVLSEKKNAFFFWNIFSLGDLLSATDGNQMCKEGSWAMSIELFLLLMKVIILDFYTTTVVMFRERQICVRILARFN